MKIQLFDLSVNAVTMGGEAHVRQETQAALEQLVKLSGTGPSHIPRVWSSQTNNIQSIEKELCDAR